MCADLRTYLTVLSLLLSDNVNKKGGNYVAVREIARAL